mmetsp:Transcript_9689/g.32415  ORF Transcript_9689/g.32415 Transcript_9689/m.32415 type:complete len:122 (+) Transcript_9689:3382-3747(+)
MMQTHELSSLCFLPVQVQSDHLDRPVHLHALCCIEKFLRKQLVLVGLCLQTCLHEHSPMRACQHPSGITGNSAIILSAHALPETEVRATRTHKTMASTEAPAALTVDNSDRLQRLSRESIP